MDVCPLSLSVARCGSYVLVQLINTRVWVQLGTAAQTQRLQYSSVFLSQTVYCSKSVNYPFVPPGEHYSVAIIYCSFKHVKKIVKSGVNLIPPLCKNMQEYHFRKMLVDVILLLSCIYIQCVCDGCIYYTVILCPSLFALLVVCGIVGWQAVVHGGTAIHC